MIRCRLDSLKATLHGKELDATSCPRPSCPLPGGHEASNASNASNASDLVTHTMVVEWALDRNIRPLQKSKVLAYSYVNTTYMVQTTTAVKWIRKNKAKIDDPTSFYPRISATTVLL